MAQNTDKFDETELLFTKEFSVGAKLHTNGWGVSLNTVKILNLRRKRSWQIEFQQIKHPKEYKQQSLYATEINANPKSYFFGKRNNFYNVNVLYGRHHMITQKGRKGAVEISFNYKGGLSLGITKPYYLSLIYADENGGYVLEDEPYSEENSEVFLDIYRIVGGSGFSYGFKEMKFHPGLMIKAGLNFDWATHSDFIKSLEVGIMANSFFKRIPILAVDNNNFIFANLYIKVILGKRS